MSTESEIRTEIELADEGATRALGRALGRELVPGQALALVGDLGAGKTCLAQGLAEGLQVDDPEAVCSPTYLLVVEHPGPKLMLHLDAYMAEKTRAFLLDGGVDYLQEAEAVLVVEWADRVAELLPRDCLWLELLPHGEGRIARLRAPAGAFRWIENL
ncbi:MAG: tRNA (adenosine(37)-N6)-threonylcarbamoyltransferase complex ATPase subunit type 1 TsaE [Planctomycetota bacterium]|jgi:tRNA threonylcarbamoyladenosine biosynthesis protein TsaE